MYMSLRNSLVLPVSLLALAFFVGCGSSSNSAQPPPSGGFSDSSFNGTYIFSFSGTDVTDSSTTDEASYFTAAGALTANGSGGLTGTIDLVDPELNSVVLTSTAVQTNLAATGNYKVTADGRASGTVSVSINGTTVPIGIDFVLTSDSHGFITRFDDNGTGSGTLDLQSGTIAPTYPASYAFSLSGVDGSEQPFVSAGAFTIDSTGAITSGLQDLNDNRDVNNSLNLALAGTVTIPSAGSVGTATLAATNSPYGSETFDVWPIDASHVKLIETDGAYILAGDALTQATAITSGQLVFTMAGLDTSSAMLASGGFFSYDGSSVVSNGLEDINDSGTVAQSVSVSGTLTATGGGRYNLYLNGFYNGVNGASGSYSFAAYPYSSDGVNGILVAEIDAGGITGGTAFPQSAQTFASSQGYGLNLSGSNGNGEVDAIAEFTANTGGSLSNGLIDENDQGSLQFDQQLGSGGTYTFDSGSTGRGEISYPATNTTYAGELNLVFYVASSSTVPFIDVDSSAQTGVGTFELQTSGTGSSALENTQAHFAALRSAAAVRRARKQK
jgi:hypothetical protein